METFYTLQFFQHLDLDLGYLNSVLRSSFMPKRFLRATLLKFGMTVYVSAVKVEVLLARFF